MLTKTLIEMPTEMPTEMRAARTGFTL
ncbi:MAG: hypothetical protein RL564_2217, partial [Pseudomonadota bacterium]